MTEMMKQKWSRRFMVAAVIHGAGVAVWSGLFLLDGIGISLNLSKIVAGGGAGTWFTVGYLLYMITGFLGMTAQGALYQYAASLNDGELHSDRLALVHFGLMNVAVVGATWMLGYAGFIGGSLTLADRVSEVHAAIVGYVNPVGICLLMGVIAALIGAYNTLMTLGKGE
jgi:hypothetical protein